MQAGLRRAAEGQDTFHHLRETHRPLIGLPRAHGPARDQLQPLDTEALGDQAVLKPDVVVHGDVRKRRAIVRFRCVTWRGRQAVAEHIGNDDEVARRIERHSFADKPFIVVVLLGVEVRRMSCTRAWRWSTWHPAVIAHHPGRICRNPRTTPCPSVLACSRYPTIRGLNVRIVGVDRAALVASRQFAQRPVFTGGTVDQSGGAGLGEEREHLVGDCCDGGQLAQWRSRC